MSEKTPARFGITDVLLDQKGLRMGSVVASLFYGPGMGRRADMDKCQSKASALRQADNGRQ